MNEIVLINESEELINRIKRMTEKCFSQNRFQVVSFHNLTAGFSYAERHMVSLIITDIQFSECITTSIPYILRCNPPAPIIIISSLPHYKLPMMASGRILRFIEISKIDSQLLPAIKSVLNIREQHLLQEYIVFPSTTQGRSSHAYKIEDILYINYHKPSTYEIHLSSGDTQTISSVSFTSFSHMLIENRVPYLVPINKNQIINSACIMSLYRTKNYRLAISLLGLEETFIVGKQKEQFVALFTSPELP